MSRNIVVFGSSMLVSVCMVFVNKLSGLFGISMSVVVVVMMLK